MRLPIYPIVLANILLVGCANHGPRAPEPQASEYLITRGGGAVFDVKDGTAQELRFGLTLEWNKLPPEGSVIVAEFESPDLDAPYRVTYPVVSGERKFTIRSPIYPCIINNISIRSVVKVYQQASLETVITSHQQRIQFSVPDREFIRLKFHVCGA